MSRTDPLETALERAFGRVVGAQTPPRLMAAMHHAVFPGGARIRPRVALAVAAAHGPVPPRAESLAVAIEFVHCASLVHDDLPCFDNAPVRRGRMSVHAKFGESLAVLAGDGLIVGAFEVLGHAIVEQPRLAGAIGVLAAAVGANGGLVAGQGWEDEPSTDVQRYHHAKTAALFEAAVCMGALAAKVDPAQWRPVGTALGEAYQIADDLGDLISTPTELGKPVGQDLIHDRPNAALELGPERAFARLEATLARAVDAVPPCPGQDEFREWLGSACARLFPRRPVVHHLPVREEAPLRA